MTEELEKGIPISALIAAPLEGASDASTRLAKSTVDYIRNVGFMEPNPDSPNEPPQARQVDFLFERPRQDGDGEIYLEEVHIKVPLLAIAPAPNLQLDSVDVEFSLEIRSTSSDNEVTDHSGHEKMVEDSLQLHGATSTHKDHTRETDKSSKYHFNIKATNHGVPEAMARILDMMAAGVAPLNVSRKEAQVTKEPPATKKTPETPKKVAPTKARRQRRRSQNPK